MEGRCGICGDPYDGPLEHQAPGGKFANGNIVANYLQVTLWYQPMNHLELKTTPRINNQINIWKFQKYINFQTCLNSRENLFIMILFMVLFIFWIIFKYLYLAFKEQFWCIFYYNFYDFLATFYEFLFRHYLKMRLMRSIRVKAQVALLSL